MRVGDDLAVALDPPKMMATCGLTPDPWQETFLRDRPARALLLASRQAGKSTVTAASALYEALYRPPSTVLLLPPAQRQSAELLAKVRGLLARLPDPPVVTGGSTGADRYHRNRNDRGKYRRWGAVDAHDRPRPGAGRHRRELPHIDLLRRRRDRRDGGGTDVDDIHRGSRLALTATFRTTPSCGSTGEALVQEALGPEVYWRARDWALLDSPWFGCQRRGFRRRRTRDGIDKAVPKRPVLAEVFCGSQRNGAIPDLGGGERPGLDGDCRRTRCCADLVDVDSIRLRIVPEIQPLGEQHAGIGDRPNSSRSAGVQVLAIVRRTEQTSAGGVRPQVTGDLVVGPRLPRGHRDEHLIRRPDAHLRRWTLATIWALLLPRSPRR